MTERPLDFLAGSGQERLAFADLDQRYHLKIQAFIELCMPPVFRALEKQCRLERMRNEGIIPIMFYLQFESAPTPLTFLSRAEASFRVHLRRSVTPAAHAAPERPGSRGSAGGAGVAGGAKERLLLDMEIDVDAPRGSGDPRALGGGEAGPPVRAGRMRAVHVITRPVAPPGQRQVIEVPEALRGLREHPWEGPFPELELLQALPDGFAGRETGAWAEQRGVWGLHNTDINQHVNVLQYIVGLEDHFTRLLQGAGLPPAGHRIARADFLFRKPFLAGDPFGARGRIFLDGARTLMLGGLHRLGADGALEPQPAVFTRMAGALDGEG